MHVCMRAWLMWSTLYIWSLVCRSIPDRRSLIAGIGIHSWFIAASSASASACGRSMHACRPRTTPPVARNCIALHACWPVAIEGGERGDRAGEIAWPPFLLPAISSMSLYHIVCNMQILLLAWWCIYDDIWLDATVCGYYRAQGRRCPPWTECWSPSRTR